jgi:hypothetical protein
MRQHYFLPILLAAVAACSRDPAPPVLSTSSCSNKADWTCDLEHFQQLPIKERLSTATAVIITKGVREDDHIVEYVDEVLKLQPGTELYLRRGAKVKTFPLSTTDYGEGAVVILRGSPASIVESYSYRDGAIPGLGHMPIATFRAMASAK